MISSTRTRSVRVDHDVGLVDAELAEEALHPLARRASGYIIASDQGPSALLASSWSRGWVDGEVGLDELVDLGLHVVANRPQIGPGDSAEHFGC